MIIVTVFFNHLLVIEELTLEQVGNFLTENFQTVNTIFRDFRPHEPCFAWIALTTYYLMKLMRKNDFKKLSRP